MKSLFILFAGLIITLYANAQTNTGLVIGDYNKQGDFVPLKPAKVYEFDLSKENPKFADLKVGDKEITLNYKVSGSGKAAIRYFDKNKNEWIDLFNLDCCAAQSKGSLMVYSAKAFKTNYDVLFFYTETSGDNPAKLLQVVKFVFNTNFKKFNIPLNPKNEYSHKLLVSKWTIREQFGDDEERFKEYSIDEKVAQ
jgi:Tol biopolymer transport system component